MFGPTLRKLRLEKGITIREFAKIVSLKENFVCQIERYNRLCGIEKLKRILEFFNKKEGVKLKRAYLKAKVQQRDDAFKYFLMSTPNQRRLQ